MPHTQRIENPNVKAEGRCLGFPYDTQLVSSEGVSIHFWMGDTPTEGGVMQEKVRELLTAARRDRDIVACTYSDGEPDGFWANQDIPHKF